MGDKKRIGEILIEQKVITREQLQDALDKQQKYSLPLGEILIMMEVVTENRLLKTLGRHMDVEFLNIAENNYQVIDRTLSAMLPRDVCERLRVAPVFLLDDGQTKQLTIAMSDPLNTEATEEVEKLTRTTVIPVLTTSSAVLGGIEKLYEKRPGLPIPGAATATIDVDQTVRYVNRLLSQAVQMGASDIHLEPHSIEVHVRFRVDGALRLIETFPLPELPTIIIRLKIMGSEKHSLMRIDEKRVPQDGSFARVIGGHAVDFRLATFPTIYGEKIAIRVLDKDSRASIHRIEDLFMPPAVERQFTRCVQQASGIIIATGPTGSGKSTTLYAAVNHVNHVDVNIVTVEDPVEYHADEYVNQSSLKVQAGYTYPVALKAIMRQDPDVILIGEIRDLETAEIAIQAALTGHLVFTTLHTDEAAGAVVRLVDLGIEQFLVSSTVVSAVNQRLLRKICPHCHEPHVPDRQQMVDLGVDEKICREILDNVNRFTIRCSSGCEKCQQTGYIGRRAAFELLTVTPPIKKLILAKETSDVITQKAREKESLNMLFEDGLRLALRGVTTFDELRKIPRGDYEIKPLAEIFETAGDDFFTG